MPAISFSIFHGRPESLVVYKSPAVTRAYTGQDWRGSMRCFPPVTITAGPRTNRSGPPTQTFFSPNSTYIPPPPQLLILRPFLSGERVRPTDYIISPEG